MSRRDSGLGKLLGVLIAAGTVAALAKYLKDYTDFEPADKEDIEDLKADGDQVKTAAKRTYVAIKEKGDTKQAASELKDAALNVAKDVGGIAKKAGNETAEAFARLKNRYKEDPQAVRTEIKENIVDMSTDIGQKIGTAAGSIVNNVTGEGKDAVTETDIRDEASADAQANDAELTAEEAEITLESAEEADDAAPEVLIHEEEMTENE